VVETLIASRCLITGCARSGTMYMAEVLNAIPEIKCTHEDVFRVDRYPHRWPPSRKFEVSHWCGHRAYRLLEDIVVFHQVKNPLRHVESLVRFYHPTRGRPETLHYKLCPDLKPFEPLTENDDTLENRIAFAVAYSYLWSKGIEDSNRVEKRYRLEDLDAEIIGELLSSVGIETKDPQSVNKALESVPKDFHSGKPGCPPVEFTWGDLATYKYCDGLKDMAERWGYG